MQKGLSALLRKYAVASAAELSADGAIVTVDGQAYPVLAHESERRFLELRNLVLTGRIGNLCTYRIGHTAKKGSDLMALLAREIGVMEYTIASPAKEIFAIAGQNTLNCIVEAENGCVCTIELGATLSEGERDIDKHEIIADGGVACDRVVDTQVPQSSIYLFGDKKTAYTDTDMELYGYSEREVATIRNAFLLAKDPAARAHNKEAAAHIAAVIKAAETSLATLENVKVEV